MPQLPSVNLTCDTVGVIQPAVTMTTSLQLKDALKLLTGHDIKPQLTYGDIWEGDHYRIGFSKMHQDRCPTCGSRPHFPYLNQNAKIMPHFVGEIQYSIRIKIFQEILTTFLEQHHIHYRTNHYMTILNLGVIVLLHSMEVGSLFII